MNKLDFFDLYTQKFNWKITPISRDSKSPIFANWNKDYNRLKSRNIIEEHDCNLGLCLGDIVDVEADTPGANKTLDQMLRGYPHPQYRSSRSVHHLFLCHDKKLTKISMQNIEFRGSLHQSVLPPSRIGDTRYQWINADFPVPEMPKSLLKFYWKHVRRVVRPLGFWTCKMCHKRCIIESRQPLATIRFQGCECEGYHTKTHRLQRSL